MKFLDLELDDWKDCGPNFYRSIGDYSLGQSLYIGLHANQSHKNKHTKYHFNCITGIKYDDIRLKLLSLYCSTYGPTLIFSIKDIKIAKEHIDLFLIRINKMKGLI